MGDQGMRELVQRQPCASGSAWGLARFGGAPFCVAVLAVIRSTFSLQRCLPWRFSQCWSRVWPQLWLHSWLCSLLSSGLSSWLHNRARSPLAWDFFFFLSSVASGWTTGAERLSNPPCRTGALEHPVRARVRGESVCF